MTEVNFTVRTRLDKAFFTVTCIDNCSHSFTAKFVTDRNIVFENSNHDAETDSVLEVLGGTIHPCGQVTKIMDIVSSVHKAAIGIVDTPKVRWFPQSGWQTRETNATCSQCARRNNTILHANSLLHQLTINGFLDNLRNGEILLRWMSRNTAKKPAYNTFQKLALDYPVLTVEEQRNHRGSFRLYVHSQRAFKGLQLTPTFINSAISLFGENSLNKIFTLRSRGIKVQWIKDLNTNLNDQARQYYRRLPVEELANALTECRNLASTKVVTYMNAGVYNHVSEYVKNGVTPEAALALQIRHNSRALRT